MDLAVLTRLGLLLIRPGTLIMLMPGLGGSHIEPRVKVGLVVLLAIGLLPSVPVPGAAIDASLVILVAREAAIGLSIGFVLHALMVGAEFAGHLSGQQIGFSYGATIDPQSGVRNNVVSTLYSLLATLGFLAINGHHAVLRALAASYARLPIGAGHIDASLVGAVRDIFALVFTVGVRLAAPIVAVLLVVEVVVGLISRSQPALSSMVIGYPLRIIIGLFILALMVGTVPAVTNSLLETTLRLAGRTAGGFR
jgi:flagellar biosynthetic protein FliR